MFGVASFSGLSIFFIAPSVFSNVYFISNIHNIFNVIEINYNTISGILIIMMAMFSSVTTFM